MQKTHGLVFLCFFLMTIVGAVADPSKLTDPVVAEQLGITVQQLHSIRNRWNLTNEQALTLSKYVLHEMLYEITHPGWDKHREEQEFRALKMMDEHGKIPPAGLLRAIEHRKHMEEEEGEIDPGVPDPSLIVPNPGNFGTAAAGLTTKIGRAHV